ncbi:MAG: DegT/DnrJ/EryC1/StrS family aminotransferase [Actinobacteria bacterium]|nr:MAG: DegT/DnrJ/EryC1/StrS family aminotransferase [Actinomycetota bacterium]
MTSRSASGRSRSRSRRTTWIPRAAAASAGPSGSSTPRPRPPRLEHRPSGVPGAALAKEASARRAGQHKLCVQATRAPHPAASDVRPPRRPAPPAVSGGRPGTSVREIPLARPLLDEREEELVLEVLRSGRLSLGPTIDRFEELLAERIGAPYVAAVSSGTAGLHLLAHIAGLGPGDEAITSPISFASSANCFIFGGATPVFADVDPRTLNLDPAAVEAAVTPRTKALVAVDMFGYPCELDELRAICERHALVLIEDAAEALGAEYKGRPIGSHGPSGVFGFYPNKQLATGEGGVVFTHSEEEWRLVRSLRNQGRDYEGGGWFHHVRVGWNYRWTDVQAAIGIAQLEKLDRLLALRSEVAARYDALLDGSGIEPLCPDDVDHRRSWFVYVVKVPEGVDRDRVMERLRAEGIGTADYVPCVHLQPYMRETYGFREGTCPVAEAAAARTLALPFYPQLEQEDQQRVAGALRAAL